MRAILSAKPLLSRPEQMLYARLVRAFPGHVILAQVALSQLLVVDTPAASTPTGGEGQGLSNRFRQMIADFVVCKPDFLAVAVIELEDAGERSVALAERNRRKDRCLHAAGIKVVRVSSQDIPSELGLKTLVATLPTHSAAPLMRRAS